MARKSIYLRLDWDDQDPRYGFRIEALRDREGRSHRDMKEAVRELCGRHGEDPGDSFEFPVGKLLDVPFPVCPEWDPTCGDPPDPQPPLMCVCKIRFTHRPIDSDPPAASGSSPAGSSGDMS